MRLPGSLYLIGGSPCAGKTSIAKAIAGKHALAEYHCDDHWDRHAREADPRTAPVLARLGRMSFAELFLRPVREQVRDEIQALREEYPLVLQDLAALPDEPNLAEGMTLLPECVATLHPTPPCVWVVPSADFQLHHYSQREWARGVAASTGDGERAFQNWMRRDITAARYVRQSARKHGFPVLVVDGSMTLAETTAWVEHHLRLA